MSSANHQNSEKESNLRPGALVDHFRIIRPLGAGGMAEVYLARDTLLGRKVALKIIHPTIVGNQEAIQRFLFEAKATARFNHPNIITIYNVGTTAKGPYLALEYLEGQTLRDRLGQESLSIKEAIRIGRSVAKALFAAHEQDLLHRDLKPDNIMLGRDGRLRVLDFGLSLLLSMHAATDPDNEEESPIENSSIAQPFVSKHLGRRGTPAYMAPEQWKGQNIGPPVDIWALGLILHEMLLGRHPFSQALSAKSLKSKVTSADPVPKTFVQGKVPFDLLALLERCLAKTPEERPSAKEVERELEQHLSSKKPEDLTDMTPFRGLLSFEEEHSPLYFGREAEIDSFVERLRHEPILPIVGLSGAGKSSFVKAGVIPRLREKGPLIFIQLRPGREPHHNLATRLIKAWQEPTSSMSGSLGLIGSNSGIERPVTEKQDELTLSATELAEQLLELPHLLGLWLQRLAERHHTHVVLFIDQLEELCALGTTHKFPLSSTEFESQNTGSIADRFMQAIACASDDPQLPIRVIVTLREEFLTRLMTSPQVREAFSKIMVLRSPSHKTLVSILNNSVNAVGYKFEEFDLALVLVDDVQESRACFPLMQFAGQVLWQQRDKKRKVLTRAAYEDMGGVTGALVQHAQGVLKGLTKEETDITKTLFLRLVTEDKTRRITSYADLLAGLNDTAANVLDRLVESRLVTISRKQEGEEGDCEIIHEALISEWDLLNRWIEESREELRLINQLEQAAELWHKRGSRVDELWSVRALKETKHFLKDKDSYSALAKSFLWASERHIQRERFRLAVFVGISMVIIILAIWFGQNLLSGKLCTGAEEKLAPIWSQHQKESVKKAFLATKLSYAQETYVRVHKIFNTYASNWSIQYKQTCEATHVRGVQSEKIMDLRMSCLNHGLRELNALVKVFCTADKGVVVKAIQAASRLSSLTDCQDVEILKNKTPPPKDKRTRKQVNELRDKLAMVKALADSGKYAIGLKHAKLILASAQETSYQPFVVEAMLWVGKLQERTSAYQEAKTTFMKTAFLADIAGQDQVRASALRILIFMLSHQLKQTSEAEKLIPYAEAANIRLKNNLQSQATWFYHLAVFHQEKGEFDQARELFNRALEKIQQVHGAQHQDVAKVLNALGNVSRLRGDLDQAEKEFRRTLAIYKKVLGSKHPSLAYPLFNLGLVNLARDYYDESHVLLSQALSIWKEFLGSEHFLVADCLNYLGQLNARRGNLKQAQKMLQRSLTIFEKALGKNHPRILNAVTALGEMYYIKGDYDEAESTLNRSLSILKNPSGDDFIAYSLSLTILGEIYLRRGKYNKAKASLEKAIKICENKIHQSNIHGRALFALAQVLAHSKQNKTQADELALDAKKIFENNPYRRNSKMHQEVSAWLEAQARTKR